MTYSFKWRKHYKELFRDNIFYKLVFKEADNYIKYRNVLSEKQDAKSHAFKGYETEVYISNLNLHFWFIVHPTNRHVKPHNFKFSNTST